MVSTTKYPSPPLYQIIIHAGLGEHRLTKTLYNAISKPYNKKKADEMIDCSFMQKTPLKIEITPFQMFIHENITQNAGKVAYLACEHTAHKKHAGYITANPKKERKRKHEKRKSCQRTLTTITTTTYYYYYIHTYIHSFILLSTYYIHTT